MFILSLFVKDSERKTFNSGNNYRIIYIVKYSQSHIKKMDTFLKIIRLMMSEQGKECK